MTPKIFRQMCLLDNITRYLREANLSIKVQKSKFCFREVRYLGYVVDDGYIRTEANKVAAPTVSRDDWVVQTVHSAVIAVTLHDYLTEKKVKKFIMTENVKRDFEKVKKSLILAPGRILFQLDNENNEHPVAFMSAKLNKTQKNYIITQQECYAAVLSEKNFRPYVKGLPFSNISDHPSLKWLMNQRDLSG